MKHWQDDKRWSDRYVPEIKGILGRVFIAEASLEDDQEKNTDLIVMTLGAMRIGCRLRRPGYFDRYGDEFTIRAGRPYGTKTELPKIIEGWGDYFFYGHASEDDSLRAWGIGKLSIFRLWFMQSIVANKGEWPGDKRSNADGSSCFLAFKWSQIPDFVIASSGLPITEPLQV